MNLGDKVLPCHLVLPVKVARSLSPFSELLWVLSANYHPIGVMTKGQEVKLQVVLVFVDAYCYCQLNTWGPLYFLCGDN